MRTKLPSRTLSNGKVSPVVDSYADSALQIERLEARNLQLEETVDRFTDFYTHSPIAFVSFNFTGRVTKMNRACEILLGVQATVMIGLSFTALVQERDCAKFLDHLRRCRRADGTSVNSEIELAYGERSLPAQLVSCRVPTETGEIFETAIVDLTEQKTAAQALQKAWEFAESIVLTIPFPVLVVDGESRVLNANRAFHETFLTSEAQVRNWSFMQLPEVQWETPGLEKLLLKTVLKEGGNLHEVVVRVRLRNDSTLIAQMNAWRLQSGSSGAPLLLVCFEDITRRMRDEEEREHALKQLEETRRSLEANVEERTVQLAQSLARQRELSEQVMLAHESEQRRIARELHDQVGQDLTALRLMFNRAAKDESNPARQTFADAERVTEEAIQNVRDICSTLRPQALDDLGLIAGLNWHFQTFGARSDLKIEFEHNGFDEKRLSSLLQSTIFRVIQEAITNVARHAETDSAVVALWMTDHDVLFRVQDRGRGFKLTADLIGHSGIANMRERVALVNGHYDLKSRPGRGTTIQVQIPLTPLTQNPTANSQPPTTQKNGKSHSR